MSVKRGEGISRDYTQSGEREKMPKRERGRVEAELRGSRQTFTACLPYVCVAVGERASISEGLGLVA